MPFNVNPTPNREDTATLAAYSNSFAVNVPLDAGGNTAFIGFTGASGGAESIQSISNFVFVSLGQGPNAPVLAWGVPGAIVYGTPLGAGQLDATANVPGTSLVNFDALDTSHGVMNDGALAGSGTPQ